LLAPDRIGGGLGRCRYESLSYGVCPQ
jgi:hypothetical protein